MKPSPKTAVSVATSALVFLLAAASGGCGPMTFIVGITPGDQTLTPAVVEKEAGSHGNQVAIIDVTGMIIDVNRPGFFSEGENPLSLLVEKLKAAAEDDDVKAVILRINSPGGTVTASDAMYREIKRFKEKTKKPVVALQMDLAASGGYYVSCAADKIVAQPTTITGSIGVILQTISFKDGLDRIGIHAEALTSGPNKDAGSPFSKMTDEQRATLKALIGDYYKRFTDIVRASRPIPVDQFEKATDGRVVSGDQALAWGLVDQLGDLHDAHALAKHMAGIEKADLVIYHRPYNYVGSPYAQAGATAPTGAAGAVGGTQVNLVQVNLADLPWLSGAGFYYLWDPMAGR